MASDDFGFGPDGFDAPISLSRHIPGEHDLLVKIASRPWLLVLSVVDCVFGVLALTGPQGSRPATYLLNFVIAVVLAIFTGRDLMARGIRLGWLIGLSYIVAPLIGLILYAIFSTRPAETINVS